MSFSPVVIPQKGAEAPCELVRQADTTVKELGERQAAIPSRMEVGPATFQRRLVSFRDGLEKGVGATAIGNVFWVRWIIPLSNGLTQVARVKDALAHEVCKNGVATHLAQGKVLVGVKPLDLKAGQVRDAADSRVKAALSS